MYIWKFIVTLYDVYSYIFVVFKIYGNEKERFYINFQEKTKYLFDSILIKMKKDIFINKFNHFENIIFMYKLK